MLYFLAAASHTEAMDESDDDYSFDTDFSWQGNAKAWKQRMTTIHLDQYRIEAENKKREVQDDWKLLANVTEIFPRTGNF